MQYYVIHVKSQSTSQCLEWTNWPTPLTITFLQETEKLRT